MIRRLLGLPQLQEVINLAVKWRDVAEERKALIVHQRRDLLRDQLDLACAWRISIEKPEVDVREDVEKIIRTLSDQVALLEEHVT